MFFKNNNGFLAVLTKIIYYFFSQDIFFTIIRHFSSFNLHKHNYPLHIIKDKYLKKYRGFFAKFRKFIKKFFTPSTLLRTYFFDLDTLFCHF